jgi:DNA polymerase III delta subunit
MAARAAREPDPPSQLRALAASVSGAKPLARGYVVRGEERYFREAAIRILIDAARARGFEASRHDTQDPDFDARRLIDDLSAAPMFAGARLVVARGAAPLLKKEARDASATERALLAFLHAQSPSGSVVIEAESLRADHAVTKSVIERGGVVVSCRRLWDSPPPWDPDPRKAELVQWLVARARERKIALDAADAVYVAQATGNDLAALDAALDRVAERESRGVREVVGWTSASSPFQVAEDLARGDVERALAGIEALFRVGFEDRDGSRELDKNAVLAVLFASLRSKLRQSLCAALSLARGADFATAAVEAGVQTTPRALDEFQKRLAVRDARAWRLMIEDLTTLEQRARSGGTVDANDVAALCLRWRVARSASVRRDERGGFVRPSR